MSTIYDIAKKVGLSPSTVARVLSGRGYSSNAAKEKVMSAADELKYTPIHAAKALKSKITNTIMMCIPDITNPYYFNIISNVCDVMENGFLRVGYNVEFGYYDQGQLMLDDELTVMDEVHNEYILYKDREIRGLLGRFLFRGDQVFNKVGSLSGGEKARLALLKLMMSGANVLVLDEPTNHLDIESKEAFEDALDDYPGTVITVTHDRYFLNRNRAKPSLRFFSNMI